MKILALNIGSTSSKLACYEDEVCVWKKNIEHPIEEIKNFRDILDQYDYRYQAVCGALKGAGIDYAAMDAVVSRGGHTRPIPGGAYRINDAMCDEVRTGDFGRHACDLGIYIAREIAAQGAALALTVDPPVTDEFSRTARYSGLSKAPRKSQFHALNHRAIAKRYARDTSRKYEELRLISAHMGGGTSVAVHLNGRMTDASNGLFGGPFSTNRAGDVPCDTLVKMCFSGEYTEKEIMGMLNGKGGLISYVGESDARIVEDKALEGDEKYAAVYEAMLYQTCKEIGAMATVLDGDIDAVILTGGIVNSTYVADRIKRSISFLGTIAVYPGESEMEALALGALEALKNPSVIKELQ